MGFDCGFYRVKKYKDVTVSDFALIHSYLQWKNNPWNFEDNHYPTFEKYWDAFCKGWDSNEKFPGEPDMDAVTFYENQPHDEYSYDTCIESWCSSGRFLDEYISHRLTPIDEYTFIGIDKDFIADANRWVDEELDRCKLIPVRVTKAYRDNEDETTTLIPCDGIFVEDEEGNQRMIDTSDEEWGEYVYVPSRYFDEDRHYALTSFREALLKLSMIDLDDSIVWYSRSW